MAPPKGRKGRQAQPEPKPRKPVPEAADGDGGAPEWMVTFADMMTLLLCFFVLLLSFANMDIEKFRDMLGSVKNAFGVQTERKMDVYIAYSSSPHERKDLNLKQEQRQQLAMAQMMKDMLDDDEAIKAHSAVNAEAGGVLFRVDNRVLFKPGTTEFSNEAKRVLGKVIEMLKKHNYDLVVEGHTDDTPPKSDAYPSNWELSGARAAKALRYIIDEGGISPTRVKAVGYASSRPLVPNDIQANRERNRRVEFFYRPPTSNYRW